MNKDDKRLMRRIVMFCLAALASACAERGPSIVEFDGELPALKYCYVEGDPHCLQGSPPGDPEPEAPGLWLGWDYTFSACTSGTMNDADRDTVDDTCEYTLAAAFRPELRFSYGEGTNGRKRESFWAVRRAPDDPTKIHIIYLLGYHWDMGRNCAPAQDAFNFCDMHTGDSEFVIVRAQMNDAMHWELSSVRLSAHWNTPGDRTYWYPRDRVQFARHYLGAPIAYAALG